MWQSNFHYYAALSLPNGDQVGEVRLKVDWIPALRWAEFERYLKDSNIEPSSASAVIEPIWDPEGTPPYIGGAGIRLDKERAVAVSFPLSYFSAALSAASSQLIASGALSVGQEIAYRIYALADERPQPRADCGVAIVALDEPPAIETADLSSLLSEARMVSSIGGDENGNSDPADSTRMPVLVPQLVLDEATALGQQVGDIETGGILVGKLLRGADGTLFSRVTAQIPVEHTAATQRSLRFTHATWASVDAAISLRARDEIPLGWWHSHPEFCHLCSPEQRALCPLAVPLFSQADKDLHREVFQQPWSIGLLLSFLGKKQPSYDVFAWHRGQIEAVNFFILPGEARHSGVSP